MDNDNKTDRRFELPPGFEGQFNSLVDSAHNLNKQLIKAAVILAFSNSELTNDDASKIVNATEVILTSMEGLPYNAAIIVLGRALDEVFHRVFEARPPESEPQGMTLEDVLAGIAARRG